MEKPLLQGGVSRAHRSYHTKKLWQSQKDCHTYHHIDTFFANLSGKSLTLALITPWNTDGKLESKENMYMTTHKASIVTDICSLKAVVGLVETYKKWGVINWVPATVMTSFTE
ncbi:hypothetical protein PAXRUDRAFT_776112, partial [Paxillus rubicundulus Ve08.2h10]